ncbi:hypothetical protein HDV00_010740 [Rhizophlyctis rosea]|nr:hypothetical protein HDV00_010740 [Rhizophlyctis rosea]
MFQSAGHDEYPDYEGNHFQTSADSDRQWARLDAETPVESFTNLTLSNKDDLPPREDEDDALTPLQLLQQIFSSKNMSAQDIESVLELCGWDLGKAVEQMFADNSSTTKPTSLSQPVAKSPAVSRSTDSDSKSASSSRPLCRHYLAGGCFRADCWYSHDIERRVCKFWVRGYCAKGDECEFAHDVTVPTTPLPPSSSSPPPTSNPTSASLTDFPSLAPPPKPKIDFWGPTVEFSEVARKNKHKPAPALPVKKGTPPKSGLPYAERELVGQDRDITRTIRWVSTGESVACVYQRERNEAIEVGRERARLIQRATQAYLSNNKALAKTLSLRAQDLSTLLQTLHTAASDRIFSLRNPILFNPTRSSQSSSPPLIDLHALHPNEAVHQMEKALKKLSRQGYKGEVCVVTGVGHHSRGRGKVEGVVVGWLEREWGSGWKVGKGVEGRGGVVRVWV